MSAGQVGQLGRGRPGHVGQHGQRRPRRQALVLPRERLHPELVLGVGFCNYNAVIKS